MEKRKLGKTDIILGPYSIGTSPLGGVFGNVPLEEAMRMCHEIVERDKYLFDTSPFYGILKSEKVLGECLKGVDRDKYYLSSKVGRYGQKEFDFSAKRIKESVSESLHRLGVEYLDILLLHDVEYVSPDIVLYEGLPALQEVKDSGYARYIGLSCEPLEVMRMLIEKSPIQLDVVLSYPHYSLLDDTLSGLFPLLEEKGIGIINASPFCGGILTKSPPPWHPITKDKLRECKQLIVEVESEYNYPIEKAALQFPLKEPGVTTTLVGLKSLEEFECLEEAVNNPIPTDIYSSIKAKMMNKISYRDPFFYEVGHYSFLFDTATL